MWFKVDDDFDSHPKVLKAGNAALGLWVRAGAWSSRHMTDGRIPRGALAGLGGTARDANRLCSAGLWETTPDGYRFHDWDHYQPSADELTARLESARQRKARSRARHNGSHASVTRPSRGTTA